MADPVKQIVGGFGSGLAAGIVGYAIDLTIGAMFEAFQQVVPLFVVYGIVYAIVSFLSGVEEAYYAGFFFSFGVISAGLLLHDSLTTISGVISIAGIIAGIVESLFFKKLM